jgi:hypothetical protein
MSVQGSDRTAETVENLEAIYQDFPKLPFPSHLHLMAPWMTYIPPHRVHPFAPHFSEDPTHYQASSAHARRCDLPLSDTRVL